MNLTGLFIQWNPPEVTFRNFRDQSWAKRLASAVLENGRWARRAAVEKSPSPPCWRRLRQVGRLPGPGAPSTHAAPPDKPAPADASLRGPREYTGNRRGPRHSPAPFRTHRCIEQKWMVVFRATLFGGGGGVVERRHRTCSSVDKWTQTLLFIRVVPFPCFRYRHTKLKTKKWNNGAWRLRNHFRWVSHKKIILVERGYEIGMSE